MTLAWFEMKEAANWGGPIRPSSVMARWGWSNRNTRLRRNWLLGKQNNIDHSLFNLIYIITQQFKICHKIFA
jgi:hypothetical protein